MSAERDAASRLEQARPAKIIVGWPDDGFSEDDQELGGAVVIEFEDGSAAALVAHWHNDGTAGLYVSFKEADQDA